MRRLRALSESECYARCYGYGDDAVRVIRVERRRRLVPAPVSGEAIRRDFEARLDAREPDAELEAEAA